VPCDALLRSAALIQQRRHETVHDDVGVPPGRKKVEEGGDLAVNYQ
jgi:hypothetical protein